MKEAENAVTEEISSFSEFNLTQEVLDGLKDVGFEKPTEIQQKGIPLILEGKNILASASTGTGKTAAFAIPILNEVFKNRKKAIQALIITPTRELAQQVDEQFWSMGYHADIPTATIYGGGDWGVQEKAITNNVNIITATPGRLMDFMKVKSIDFSQLDFLVLDEADRMLDMGFIPDIKAILKKLPEKRQNLMFSATMPPKIEQLANTMMSDPVRINISPMKPAEGISQKVYNVDERDKLDLTLHLFDTMEWSSAIIFTATKRNADVLAKELQKKGANVTSIHGDRTQEEREAALKAFRKNEYKIIVATDVIARGIDIDNVSHVINYSVPHDTEDYIHRVGRTARAEATGDAITFVSGQDRRYMHYIYKELGDKIQKMELPDEIAYGRGGKDDSDSKDQKKARKNGRPAKGKTQGKDSRKKQDEESDSRQEKDNNQHRKRGKRGGRKRRGGDQPSKGKQGDDQSTPKPQGKSRGKGKPRQDGEQQSSGKPPAKGKPGTKGRGPKKQGDDNRRKSGPPKGKGGPPPHKKRRGPAQEKKGGRKPDSRKELIDNVKSPDMDKLEKAGKKGVWGKIKSLFGGS